MSEYRHDEWCSCVKTSPWYDGKCTCYVRLLDEKETEIAALRRKIAELEKRPTVSYEFSAPEVHYACHDPECERCVEFFKDHPV